LAYSMTVISEPRRPHTEPSSRPMTPPPCSSTSKDLKANNFETSLFTLWAQGLKPGAFKAAGQLNPTCTAPAADDHHALGHLRERQRAGGGDDGFLVHVDAGQRRGLGARGEDHALGADGLQRAVLRGGDHLSTGSASPHFTHVGQPALTLHTLVSQPSLYTRYTLYTPEWNDNPGVGGVTTLVGRYGAVQNTGDEI
jgi:hypothetical protein